MYEVHQNKLIREFEEWQSEENDESFRMPTHKIVCPRCEGKGKHDHPAFSNGISQDQFDDDPDFFEDYMNGAYDVRCEECNGQNVIDEVDEDRLTDETRQAWQEWQESAWDVSHVEVGSQDGMLRKVP